MESRSKLVIEKNLESNPLTLENLKNLIYGRIDGPEIFWYSMHTGQYIKTTSALDKNYIGVSFRIIELYTKLYECMKKLEEK